MSIISFLLPVVFFAVSRLVSFHPYNLNFFIFILYIPLFLFWKTKKPPLYIPLLQGLLSGFLISLQVFFPVLLDPFQSNIPIIIAFIYFSLYYLSQWGLFSWLLKKQKFIFFLLLPITSFLFTKIISFIPNIFPLYLSLSLPTKLYTPIQYIGIAGMDSLIILINASFGMLIYKLSLRKGIRSIIPYLILLVLVGSFIFSSSFSAFLPKHNLKVLYIQKAIPPWQYSYLDYNPDGRKDIAWEYLNALKESPSVNLAVLPESALLGSPKEVEPYWDFIKKWCKEQNSYCIAQSEYKRKDGKISNAALLIDPSGNTAAIYEKQNLVLGEESGFFASGNNTNVFKIGNASAGILICYDVMFEKMYKKWKRKNVDFLIGLSNDTFAGLSAIAYLHFSYSRLFSLQYKIPVLYVGQTGCSGFICPNGSVFGFLSSWEEGIKVIDLKY